MAATLKAPANRKESNIWQHAKTGRWHWEVTLKRPDGTEYRRAGSRKTEPEARTSRDSAYAEFNQTQGRAGRWTVQTWALHVQQNVWSEELAETTGDAYAYAIKNHVLPKLGGMRIDGVSVPALQEWANRLSEAQGRNVAANAITALSSILTRAVEAGLIPINPARSIKLRKQPIGEESKMILSKAEQDRLIAAAEGTSMFLPVILGLRFGLRMGECLGLRWADVDLKARELKVAQQAQYVKGKGIKMTDPKSKQGLRILPIPEPVLPILAAAKTRAGSLYVCTKDGKLISAKKSPHYFKAVAVAAGFSETTGGVPTHHDLRSTFLTHLANHANNGMGVKPHVLMAIAGHSNIATTMKFYIRASGEDLKAAMACVS
jgi:integrase